MATWQYTRSQGKENRAPSAPDPYANNGVWAGVPGNTNGWAPGEDPIGRYFNIGFRYRR